MRIGLLMLCSTGLMAVFAPPAAAQEVPPLTPGARVRVWAPELRDHKLAGTLVELGADTLVWNVYALTLPPTPLKPPTAASGLTEVPLVLSAWW